jgi:phage gpG-like protein
MSDTNKISENIKKIVQQVKSDALKVLAIEAERSIRKNFDEGGRPKWTPRKRISKRQRGTNILVISGAMKNVIATQEGDKVVVRVNPLAREYAAIQNFGGAINMPGRNIKFREKKNKYGNTVSVFASSRHKRISKEVTSKPYQIKIPARPFMTIPEQDYQRILNAIKSQIKL